MAIPPPENFHVLFIGANVALVFNTVSNVLYDVQASPDLQPGSWSDLTNNIIGTGGMITNVDTGASAFSSRFYRLRSHL